MADSIHDQWPEATSEWQNVTANFVQAWHIAYAAYDKSADDAGFAASIDYLARMFMDEAVMAGDMITHIVQTDVDNTRGLIQNFQNLQRHVLPQWGALAADYAEQRAVLRQHQAVAQADRDIAVEANNRAQADAREAASRLAADQLEAQQRGLGDEHSREQAAAALAAEANTRAENDAHTREQAKAGDAAVAAAMTKLINNVLAYAQSIPGLIDQAAAKGYDPTLAAQASLLQKLLDTAVAHEPLIATAVSDLVKFVIDLAGIEDPVLRVAAQLVLKQVVDKLGLDTALGAMVNALIGNILGGGQPKTVTSIMADIGNRLDALEQGQADLSPLAPEADQLHELGTLVFDASLLAYFTAAVVAPVATADDTVTVFAPVTGPLLAPIRAMLGM